MFSCQGNVTRTSPNAQMEYCSEALWEIPKSRWITILAAAHHHLNPGQEGCRVPVPHRSTSRDPKRVVRPQRLPRTARTYSESPFLHWGFEQAVCNATQSYITIFRKPCVADVPSAPCMVHKQLHKSVPNPGRHPSLEQLKQHQIYRFVQTSCFNG